MAVAGRVATLRPRGDADGLIAATAIVLIVVSRDMNDFSDTAYRSLTLGISFDNA